MNTVKIRMKEKNGDTGNGSLPGFDVILNGENISGKITSLSLECKACEIPVMRVEYPIETLDIELPVEVKK